MQKPTKRLGRGLNSLISLTEEPAVSVGTAHASEAPLGVEIDVGLIRPNPFQPRQEMDPEQLQALAQSIRENGLLQPVLVRRKEENVYELIAGERRWRASQMAGFSRIPAIIRQADDQKLLEIAIVENIFREDLNAIDRAMAYRRYCDEFGLGADQMAARLGEDRSTIANYLRLLELKTEIKQLVAENRLSMGHARALLSLRSSTEQVKMAQQIIDRDLSVREVEKLVREHNTAKERASRADASDSKRAQIRSLEEAFARSLSTKVEIAESRRKGSGKIIIHYFNLDDFDRITERLGVENH